MPMASASCLEGRRFLKLGGFNRYARAPEDMPSFRRLLSILDIALVASGKATDWPDGICTHWRSPTFRAYRFDGILKNQGCLHELLGRRMLSQAESV